MHYLIYLLKVVVILAAASILGNMFLTEVRKARAVGKPWYAPYFTVPGIMILTILTLPAILWLL